MMKITSTHNVDQSNRPISGCARGPGLRIDWSGLENEHGAQPVDVLKATQSRLQHLQTTPAGSDKNARALFAVIQAIDALTGDQQVSTPVPPTTSAKEEDPS